MFSLCGKVRDKAAVSNKPFIPDARVHMSACVYSCPMLPRGITTETYLMAFVANNTLHLPFKIKATIENKNQIYANAHIQSKTKIESYLKPVQWSTTNFVPERRLVGCYNM